MLAVLMIRAYLELKQIKTYLEETECKKNTYRLYLYLKSEKNDILDMTREELQEFLDNLAKSLSS